MVRASAVTSVVVTSPGSLPRKVRDINVLHTLSTSSATVVAAAVSPVEHAVLPWVCPVNIIGRSPLSLVTPFR